MSSHGTTWTTKAKSVHHICDLCCLVHCCQTEWNTGEWSFLVKPMRSINQSLIAPNNNTVHFNPKGDKCTSYMTCGCLSTEMCHSSVHIERNPAHTWQEKLIKMDATITTHIRHTEALEPALNHLLVEPTLSRYMQYTVYVNSPYIWTYNRCFNLK